MDAFDLTPVGMLFAVIGSATALLAALYARREGRRGPRERLATNVGTAGLAVTFLVTPVVTLLTGVPWSVILGALVLVGAAGGGAAAYALAPVRSSPGSPK